MARTEGSCAGETLALPQDLLAVQGVDKIEGAWKLLHHVPTLLLAGDFMLQEIPRFEIPPLPR